MINNTLKWCLYILILLSVLFPVGAYIGVTAGLFLAVKARRSRQMLAELSQDTDILIMLFCVLLSVIYSRDKLLSLGGAVMLSINIGLLLMLIVELKNIKLQRYYQVLNTACILTCLYGIYQLTSGNINILKSWVDEKTFGTFVRIYGTMLNPNIFAAYLAMNLSFGAARFRSLKEDKLLTCNMALASLCLLLTYSRGGFAAFVTAMLVLCLIKKRVKGVIAYLAVMTALFLAMNSAGSVNRADLTALSLDSSSLYRFEIWKAALNMFRAYPIFGHGIGTTWYYLSSGSDKLFKYILHSHNIYLQVAAEMGIVGLYAFIYLIAKKLYEGYRVLQLQLAEEKVYVIQGFMASTAGVAVHGLVDAVIFVPAMSLVFVGYYAMYVRVSAEYRQELQKTMAVPALQWIRAGGLLNSKGVLKLFWGKDACEDKYKKKDRKAYEA